MMGFALFCSQIAPVTAVVLVLAPLPTVRKVIAERTTSGLPILPYSSMIANAFLWVAYGMYLALDFRLTRVSD